ncbi:hypothetical protein E3N88_20808 [Mikania micrantha]|uniref:DNA-3-methyladenine glycosylase II n=1 Tax=Mikania micrantha TaxID=192012 RepID=A0A5N6NKM8_9ASTR|nr:hypothetical protein E3N88_20808 [Mikania micrantha]
MAKGGPAKDELEVKKVNQKSAAPPCKLRSHRLSRRQRRRRWKGFTQSNAKISKEIGGDISIFDGSVTGTNMELQEGKLIVQKWRFGDWPDGLYSTVRLVLEEPKPGVTVVKLTQTDVPEEDRYGNSTVVENTERGWRDLIFHKIRAKFPILGPDFYQIDALDLAPKLLGKYLRRDDVVLQITEVEAYRSNDSACHGRVGVTSRTAPLFGPGGHAYVYLCYGLHTMLNVVADKQGIGSAVLIRSCAPVAGLETIKRRRGLDTEKPVLLTGPAKVGKALGISTDWSNQPLFTPGGLQLLDGPDVKELLVGPRVGIDYALPEHVAALWRFAIAGCPWISAPKNTLNLLMFNTSKGLS